MNWDGGLLSLSSLTPMNVTSGATASRFADSPVPCTSRLRSTSVAPGANTVYLWWKTRAGRPSWLR